MSKIDTAITNLNHIDTLAALDSPIHRLDPRAKLLTTLVFIVAVVSFDKYQVAALLPFVIFPIVLITVGGLPLASLLSRILWILPFAVLVGIFNPILDQQIVMQIGSFSITGGWVSFISILLRFFLTTLAALILIASTGMGAICLSLEKIGVPNIFVVQLLFLYRYIFVLVDEAARMLRAWQLRAPLRRAMLLSTFTMLTGSLFLRTTARAQRISQAMYCRGFTGQIHPARQLRWTAADTFFAAGFILLFVVFRFTNPAYLLGEFIMGLFK